MKLDLYDFQKVTKFNENPSSGSEVVLHRQRQTETQTDRRRIDKIQHSSYSIFAKFANVPKMVSHLKFGISVL
jgi:hypothetical protein